jgi:hypothetical protein
MAVAIRREQVLTAEPSPVEDSVALDVEVIPEPVLGQGSAPVLPYRARTTLLTLTSARSRLAEREEPKAVDALAAGGPSPGAEWARCLAQRPSPS